MKILTDLNKDECRGRKVCMALLRVCVHVILCPSSDHVLCLSCQQCAV